MQVPTATTDSMIVNSVRFISLPSPFKQYEIAFPETTRTSSARERAVRAIVRADL